MLKAFTKHKTLVMQSLLKSFIQTTFLISVKLSTKQTLELANQNTSDVILKTRTAGANKLKFKIALNTKGDD